MNSPASAGSRKHSSVPDVYKRQAFGVFHLFGVIGVRFARRCFRFLFRLAENLLSLIQNGLCLHDRVRQHNAQLADQIDQLSRVDAVSYTHLDVYKRQVHVHNSLKKGGHAKAQPRFRPSFLEQTHFFAFSGC